MGTVTALRRQEFIGATAALAVVSRYLDRCDLAPRSVKAYRRQCAAFVDWLNEHTADHADAFMDHTGANGAVAAWRRHLVHAGAKASTVNQGLTAVALMFREAAGLTITTKMVGEDRARTTKALTPAEQAALERASLRRSPQDAALVAVMLFAGLRVEECARLTVDDVAITARTGQLHVIGKGDQPRTPPLAAIARERLGAWLDVRGREPGPLWLGQRGPLTVEGITKRVLALGAAAGIPGLRPHRLRHTCATRLRQSGADLAQIQAILGHAKLETTATYFHPGQEEQAAAVENAFK